MNKAEPRFDLDLSYGKQGEQLIGTFLEWIMTGGGQIEVKRKRILDLNFYVETHCDKGRTGMFYPSGVLATTAVCWAFVIGDTGISLIVPTAELRTMLDDPSSMDKSEHDGSCPTRGKLISLSALLYRHKQRKEQTATPPAPTVRTSNQPCVHKPEHRKNGVCWICTSMAQTNDRG